MLFFSGYCRETNVRASIEIVGTQQVIFDVDSKDLVPLEEFTVDVAVCLGIKYVVTDQIPEISQKLAGVNIFQKTRNYSVPEKNET